MVTTARHLSLTRTYWQILKAVIMVFADLLPKKSHSDLRARFCNERTLLTLESGLGMVITACHLTLKRSYWQILKAVITVFADLLKQFHSLCSNCSNCSNCSRVREGCIN